MAIDKEKHTGVLVNFPDELLEKVESYWHDNRIKNRTQAILELIEKGLEKEQSE